MQGFMKIRVPLSLIRPSGQNPREDFGDIDALAASIAVTGGEPVNPPVLVQDGALYRIIDGERRYRALMSLYGDERGRMVSALVTDTMSDANELVAMLATDDKRQLNESERAKGVQQMLLLGIDDERAAAAAHAGIEQVRAVRRLHRAAPQGVQLTLDQYTEAAAFDDEEDRQAVMAAGEGYLQEAARIRDRIARGETRSRDLAPLAEHGVPVLDDVPDGMRPQGWERFGAICEWDDDWSGIEIEAVREWGNGWQLLVTDEGGGDDAVSAEQRAHTEALHAREQEAAASIARELAQFALKSTFMPAGVPRLWRVAMNARRVPWAVQGTFGEEVDAEIERQRTELNVSDWEMRVALLVACANCAEGVKRGGFWRGSTPAEWVAALELFRDLGFDAAGISDDAAWFCDRMAAEAENGGDGE